MAQSTFTDRDSSINVHTSHFDYFLNHWSPTRGPPDGIMWSAAAFVRHVFIRFIHSFIHSFIPQSVLRQVHNFFKRVLHTVRSSASPFNFQPPLLSFKSSSSCLFLLPCLPVTSILPIFPSIVCFSKEVPTQDVTDPISLPSSSCM